MYEPNYIPFMRSLSNIFSTHFSTVDFRAAAGCDTFPAVYCSNVLGLLTHLEQLHRRRIRIVHCSADMGQHFLKIAISPSLQVATPDDHKDSDPPADDHPEHGRRRTIIIASVRDQPETLPALRKLFLLLQLPTDQHEFVYIADYKLLNIIFGLSTHSATFPCVFCERSLLPAVPLREQLTAAKLRTVAGIKTHAKRQKEKAATPSQHRSCIARPLSVFPPSQPIEQYVAQPPLHTMLGVFNWCYDLLERNLSATACWSSHYNVVRSEYHGHNMEGNGCRRLLRPDALDYLQSIIDHATPADNPHTATRVLVVLRAFARLRTAIYSHELKPQWQTTIDQFRVAVLQLPVRRFPTKVHSICAHLRDWCELSGVGCAEYTDEWIEQSHHLFRQLWDNSYSIRDNRNPVFQVHHLKAVLRFNSRNIPVDSAASELSATSK